MSSPVSRSKWLNREPMLAACVPLLTADDPTDADVGPFLGALPEDPSSEDVAKILLLLQRHRIDQLVTHALSSGGWDSRVPAELREVLSETRRRQTIALMQRQGAAEAAREALRDIPHVFFKGLGLAEWLYGDPLLRPSVDIDVLVLPADRSRAREALGDGGFTVVPQADQPPYEEALFGHGAHLDLHWHPVSPVRSRIPLTPLFLGGRQERAGSWYPSAEATLLALLLNPSLTDHVTQSLIHALDLHRFLRARTFDQGWVVDTLRRAGLAAAAWAMLEHTRCCLGPGGTVADALHAELAPSARRRRLIQGWLDRDPAELHGRHPLWVRGGFGVLLHDSLVQGLWALGRTALAVAIRNAINRRRPTSRDSNRAASSESAGPGR